MEEMESNKCTCGTCGFLAPLIIGAVVGLAIGFLFAPQRGEETRKILRDKAQIAKARAAELVQKTKEAARQAKK